MSDHLDICQSILLRQVNFCLSCFRFFQTPRRKNNIIITYVRLLQTLNQMSDHLDTTGYQSN